MWAMNTQISLYKRTFSSEPSWLVHKKQDLRCLLKKTLHFSRRKTDDICCDWCFKGSNPLDMLDAVEA